MKRIALLLPPVLGIALAGCSSSSSSLHPSSGALGTGTSSIPGISAMSGTETIAGAATGKTVLANQTTFRLTFSGPIKATGTFTTPNTNATHQTATFKTTAGNMVASAIVSGQNNQPTMLPGGYCGFTQTVTAAYTIDGMKSTGSWKNATGHGTVKVVIQASMPRFTTGKCNFSSSATPIAKTAVATFNGSGPVTVK